MLKSSHAELVYKEICYGELKNKFNNKPAEIERILFLMQYNAFKNGRMRVYKYKTYIDGTDIRIKYMSDLLRVMPLTDIIIGDRYDYNEKKDIEKNREEVKNYTDLSDERLKEIVKWVIENEELDPKYFVYGKYKSKLMRASARLHYYAKRHPLAAAFHSALAAYLAAILIGLVIGLPIIQVSISKEYLYQMPYAIKGLIVMGGVPGIPWLLWSMKITKPTWYEKDKHY